jgi:uncharacterized phage infection (PIP) family protein YhgE
VTLDRQSIERRDFPIGRRGYEPAAVDSHLRSLAAEVDELERSLDEGRPGESLGSAAGSQVQGILDAAEATAADIEQQAAQAAAVTRAEADSDAARTRSDAIAQAQSHVRAVSEATAALLRKVESMDQEVSALVQSLQTGAGRLVTDLQALETNMGELYDAASGAGGGGEGEDDRGAGAGSEVASVLAPEPLAPVLPVPAPPVPAPPVPSGLAAGTGTDGAPSATNGSSELHAPGAPSSAPASAGASAAAGADDLDGARLIALNMALNGQPREQADRYLAENFELSDREKLLDEVYAAIDG